MPCCSSGHAGRLEVGCQLLSASAPASRFWGVFHAYSVERHEDVDVGGAGHPPRGQLSGVQAGDEVRVVEPLVQLERPLKRPQVAKSGCVNVFADTTAAKQQICTSISVRASSSILRSVQRMCLRANFSPVSMSSARYTKLNPLYSQSLR